MCKIFIENDVSVGVTNMKGVFVVNEAICKIF